jgi:hypothetical protein
VYVYKVNLEVGSKDEVYGCDTCSRVNAVVSISYQELVTTEDLGSTYQKSGPRHYKEIG